MGGISYLKAIKKVFPQIEFIPTGGINLENVVDYIKSGASAVGVGGELTNGQESIITENARNIRNIIKLKWTNDNSEQIKWSFIKHILGKASQNKNEMKRLSWWVLTGLKQI